MAVLRYLRRTRAGGAVEYLAQFLDGLVHPELLRSGATLEEECRALPGDGLVPLPMWEATRTVTIDAAPAEVWPWVAQMGYGRGGWYGWNPLEQEDTGVAHLLPELPPPSVGDIWLNGPGCTKTKGAWTAKTLETPRTLVLHSRRDPVTGRELEPGRHHVPIIDTAWSFHLQRLGPQRTRVVASTRVVVRARWALMPSSGWVEGMPSCRGGYSPESRPGPRRARAPAERTMEAEGDSRQPSETRRPRVWRGG